MQFRPLMKDSRTILTNLIIFFLLMCGFSVCLAAPLPVQLAGFAFRGNSCQIEQYYPFVSEVDKEKSEKIKNIQLKNIHLITDKYSNLEAPPLTLACCLDNEMVSREEYVDGYKIVIDLSAQILLFDFTSFKLIACYPFSIQLIHFSKLKPTDEIISKMIRNLLLSNKYEINLLDEFTHVLANVEIKKFYGGAMQVTDVIIEKKAMPFLPEKFKKHSRDFETFVAQNFGKYLSKNQSISILPYTKGYSIGNKMAVRFSNAEVFHLKIPDPQFAIQLTIRGFKKVFIDEKVSGSSWVYGAFAHVSITQPLLNKSYLDENVKNGVVKIIPALQKSVDEWPIYQESLMGCDVGLFDKLTKYLSEKTEYKKVKEVLARCR